MKQVTINGVTYNKLNDALRAFGTTQSLYYKRRRLGWPMEKAIIEPAKKTIAPYAPRPRGV